MFVIVINNIFFENILYKIFKSKLFYLILPHQTITINTYEMYTQNNFYQNTYAEFKACDKPNRNSDFISESGSIYYYLEEGVIRLSDHWGDVSSCKWNINTETQYELDEDGSPDYEYEIPRCGFCKWEDFSENLFFYHSSEMSKPYKIGDIELFSKDLGLTYRRAKCVYSNDENFFEFKYID